MNLIKKYWQKIILATFIFLLPVISFAEDTDIDPVDPCKGKICNPLSLSEVETVPELIKIIIKGMLSIGIPIVVLAVIYCGFLFVAARGNTEKLGKAKDALLYTVIGAAILLGSWAIAEMISVTVTGLSSTTP